MAIGLLNKRMFDDTSIQASCGENRKGASRRWFLAALTGTLLLTGCISPPKSKTSKLSIDAPGDWKSAEAQGDFEPQNWVKDFNDPQLVEIIEEALAHNYNLQAAASRLDASVAGSKFARSAIWPSLTGSISENRNKRSSASGIQQTPTSETFGVNARFNWELDIWGKVRNGYRGDMADIQSAHADYAAARLSIAGRVAQAWYSAIEARQQYELAEGTQEALEASALIVEENFKRGIARALDVRLVRANVASNRGTLETRLRSRDSSVRILETLLGRYPGNDLMDVGHLTTRNEIEAHNQLLDDGIAALEAGLSLRESQAIERLKKEQLALIPEAMREDVEDALNTARNDRNSVQTYIGEKFEKVANFDIEEALEADTEFNKYRTRIAKEIAEKNSRKKSVLKLGITTQSPVISGPVPAGLPSELLLRRPDVVSAERTLAATEQRKFETSKARIPSINLTLSRGTSSRDLENIFEVMDRRVWNQSLNIAQTIFQGGRLRANHKRAKANYELSLANYSNTVLTAFREVETALNNQSSFERDFELQKVAAEESIAAEQLAWEEYGRGLSTITTALDAVRRSINAQRALIQVSNQRVQSRIDLYLALGGGFDLEPTAED